MSMYKIFLNRDKNEAYQMHIDRQKTYKKAHKITMYLALFGGMLAATVIKIKYGETAAALCGLVGIVWYVLGYFYCETLWKIEKDNIEFNNAVKEYESLHYESS